MIKTKMRFADQIKWRIRILWCMIIALLAYMVIVSETGGGDSRIQTWLAETLSSVMFFGGLIWTGWRIHYNKKLLEDRLRLKAQALKERDEYRRMLHLRSGGPVMDAMLLILYIATMTAAMYNMDMFHMAYGLFVAALLLKFGMYWAVKQGYL